MIFCLSEDLFENNQNTIDIVSLIRNSHLRRHTILIKKATGKLEFCSDNESFSDWLKSNFIGTAITKIKLLTEACSIISSTNTTYGGKFIHVANVSSNKKSITAAEAVLASAQPLYIVVENKINDAEFIRRIMPKVWREKFSNFESKGLIKFEQGGGISEIQKIIERHSQDDTCRRIFGLGTNLWAELHFIIYDHDGGIATSPSEQSKKIEQKCIEIKCRNHRLRRRKQENYLPKEAVEKIIRSSAVYECDKENMQKEVEKYFSSNNKHHSDMPSVSSVHSTPKSYKKIFKNKFGFVFSNNDDNDGWKDEWFKNDDSIDEMIYLAEAISACL